MPKQNESLFVSHVFVCTNDRGGERKSCADNNSQLIKSKLKDAVDDVDEIVSTIERIMADD